MHTVTDPGKLRLSSSKRSNPAKRPGSKRPRVSSRRQPLLRSFIGSSTILMVFQTHWEPGV